MKLLKILLVVVCLSLSPLGYSNNHPLTLKNDTLVIKVPTTFDESNLSIWRSIADQMNAAKQHTIILLWQGYGGETIMGMQFISEMINARQSGHFIIIDVTGFTASAHANPVCFADKVIIENGAELYFHRAYTEAPDGTRLGTRFVPNYIIKLELEVFHICVLEGFMSDGNVKSIMLGYAWHIVHQKGKEYRYLTTQPSGY